MLIHYGHWVQPSRRQSKGPLPKPRWMPLPQLRYAQVVKTVRQRRPVRVRHRGVFGTLEAVQQVLAACGWQINMAFIERVNLSMRQHMAAVGRRVSTLCKGDEGLRQQLALYQAVAALYARDERGADGPRVDLRAMLLYRVSLWPQPQALYVVREPDDREEKRVTCIPSQGKRPGADLENPM